MAVSPPDAFARSASHLRNRDRIVYASTKKKRLDQMLDELERGDVYMNMPWSPAKRIRKEG
jgi:hypothetical protein